MDGELVIVDDPGAFLDAAGELFATEPVEATVIVTVTDRIRRERDAGLPGPTGFPVWWAVERDGSGQVIGAAMRTAPFAPHPVYVMRLTAEGALALARALHDRGEVVGGVNGALPATELFAAEAARLAGRRHRIAVHTRLFELGDLLAPALPPGRARRARPEEADLAVAWFTAFAQDAAEQAGRSEPHEMEAEDRGLMLRRIDDGSVWVWEDATGTVVHLTGVSRPMFGVSRIGPVYTPPEHRGRGYAGATVAAVSRSLLDAGVRVCLFTDQANPVSNALYERLGFRALADQAQIILE
jgi:RimJ/RimL family protein N-acetyltransferase